MSAITFAIGMAAAQAAAGQELVTDRPDFTESALTVPAGRRQLEGGYTLTRAGAASAHALGELLLRLGLTRRLELRGGLGTYAWTRTAEGGTSGVEDVGLGVKVALSSGQSGTEVLGATTALLLAGSLPVGPGGGVGVEGKLAAAWDLPWELGLGVNLNAAWQEAAGVGYWEPSASASLAFPLGARLGGFFEGYGFLPAGRADAAYLNAGLTWAVHPELQLDVRAGTRLDGPDERFLGIGVARRW